MFVLSFTAILSDTFINMAKTLRSNKIKQTNSRLEKKIVYIWILAKIFKSKLLGFFFYFLLWNPFQNFWVVLKDNLMNHLKVVVMQEIDWIVANK